MALNFQNNEASSGRVSFIIALAVSLVCLGVYAAEGANGPIHRIQAIFEGMAAPLQQASAPLGAAVEEAEQGGEDQKADEGTLAALREQNEQLTQQLTTAEEQRLENERLRNLLNLRDTYEIQGVAARVIGRSTDAWNQDITLDAGSNQGVESGLTVMGPTGVIGQVISTAANSCRVRLLTDPQSGAAAMVQSSRAEGIVRGSLDGLLYLENISADVNIQVGDVVLTSGLGGSYTRGLLIGTVARVEGSAGNDSRRIVVAPNGSVELLQEALVVFSAASDAADRAVTFSSGDSAGTGEGDSAAADGTAEGGDAGPDGAPGASDAGSAAAGSGEDSSGEGAAGGASEGDGSGDAGDGDGDGGR